MRGHALRYLGWQLLDRAGPRVLGGWFVAAGFLSILYMATRRDMPSPEQVEMILGQMHFQLGFIFLLLLMNGIVAQDRLQGFFRFYLAKPVSPVWFYGQHALLAFAGMLAASSFFITAGSLLLRPVWPWHLLAPATAMFLLFGMGIFLCSTFVKHDWLLAGVVLIAAAIAKDRWPRSSGRLGEVLHSALPPTHLMGWNKVPDAGQWAWIAAWGLGMFSVALLVLRLRPLGED